MTTANADKVEAGIRRLLHLISTVPFGRIENLAISNGEPNFGHSALRVVRKVKLGPARSGRSLSYHELLAAREVRDLLSQIAAVKEGLIHRIEILDGRPVFLELAAPQCAQGALGGQ